MAVDSRKQLEQALAPHHARVGKVWQRGGRSFIQLWQEVYPDSDGSGSFKTFSHNDLDAMYSDLTLHFKFNEEVDIMNIFGTDLFSYLAGEMFLDENGNPRTVKLTVSNVEMEDLHNGRGGTENKPTVSFKERDKKLVLNKTNAKAIASQYGPETDNWKGKKIAITAEHGAWFGKKGVRVVVLDHLPANGNGKKQAPPPPPTEVEQIPFDIDEETGEIDEGAYAE